MVLTRSQSVASQLDQVSSEPTSPSTMSDLDALILDRSIIASQLKLMEEDLSTIAQASFATYAAEIQQLMGQLTPLHRDILKNAPASDFDQHVGEFTAIKRRALHLAAQFSLVPASMSPAPSINQTLGSTNSQGHSIRLPEIQLPTFSGEHAQWPAYAARFKALVARCTQLTDDDKLEYLQSSMRGEAKTLLASFLPGSGQAYDDAWQMLESIYQNQRHTVDSIVFKLLQYPDAHDDASLRKLIETFRTAMSSLTILKLDPTQADYVWNCILLSKCSGNIRSSFEQCQKTDKIPPVTELLQFLQKHLQARTYNAANTNATSNSLPTQKAAATFGQQEPKQYNPTKRVSKCPECALEHYLGRCPVYTRAVQRDRYFMANKHKVCINCLTKGHAVKDCSRSVCQKCGKKHHTTLHREAEAAKATTVVHAPELVLLQTAIIQVEAHDGTRQPIRALLDGGSTISLITKKALQALHIKPQATECQVMVAGGKEQVIREVADIKFHSNDGSFSGKLKAFAMPHITGVMPSRPVETNWEHLASLNLADRTYATPGKIDILIGADILHGIMLPEMRLKENAPTAQKSLLGWVLQGPTKATNQVQVITHASHQQPIPDLSKFWEVEEVPNVSTMMTAEEQEVEHLFVNTTKVLPDGRFCVRLPTRSSPPILGDNHQTAAARLRALERKFASNSNYQSAYKQTLQDYFAKKHISEIVVPNTPQAFLPHHGIINARGKLRIVFDGSAKTSSGTSLNEELLNGPKTQPDLFQILARFRTYNVAVSADIVQMYRQVWVHEEDRHLQRILWRDDPELPIRKYELSTVTWGTKPASYLATRVLKEIAKRAAEYMPTAAFHIDSSFYVDDLLAGGDSVDDVKKLIAQISQLLDNAGFTLHKWASNSPKVTRPNDDNVTTIAESDTKTLGVRWHQVPDTFSLLTATPMQHAKVTKRTVLSDLGQFYDPMGWVTPALIRPKVFVQHLWRLPIDWDKQLPVETATEWASLMQDLQHLSAITIPRRVLVPEGQSTSICAFCDASESAYAAVVYIRQYLPNGKWTVHMMASKTKVAPLKPVSLPRLELLGAILLTKLVKIVQLAFNQPVPITAFTDSTIALHWLSGHPSKWKTFVANRVKEAQEVIAPENWRHVVSADNPADLATRQFFAKDLVTCDMWWHGPGWLRSDTWPVKTIHELNSVNVPEEKKPAIVLTITSSFTPLLSRYENISKILRILAYVRRIFIPKADRPHGLPNAIEIQKAREDMIRIMQAEAFPHELEALNDEKQCPRSSPLQKLTPFLDDNGLIRVGGRLRNANIDTRAKHPLVLPYSKVSKMIVRHLHILHAHAGPQLLASIVSQRYYIPRIRNLTRFVARTCATCARFRANLGNQLMADLPFSRVTPARPFQRCGVDFAGPFMLKTQLARGTRHFKGYISIFVCLSTRAVHIELVSSLSADAFLAAFSRMCGRRSTPAHVYSDNGTNFTAASQILKKIQESEKVLSHLASQEIRWTFNPPAAPHWGGLWEAGVRSFKYHFNALVKNNVLTFEEMATVACKIEAVMNSRPLTPLSSDPSDLEPLTPGHFLVGAPLTAPPERIEDAKILPNERWKLVNQIAQNFWSRWASEYLTRLNQRPKWCRLKDAPRVDELVIIHEPMAPPLKWRMGRIVEVHDSPDGLPRAVTLRTQHGHCMRPITKIARLPLDEGLTADDASRTTPHIPCESAVPLPLPCTPADADPEPVKDAAEEQKRRQRRRRSHSPEL